jgi:hypothetical protein
MGVRRPDQSDSTDNDIYERDMASVFVPEINAVLLY